ncbi:hypothetical protein J2T56_001177 [Natronobacillus azotifigens]
MDKTKQAEAVNTKMQDGRNAERRFRSFRNDRMTVKDQ